MTYSVQFRVERPDGPRDRLRAFARPLLAVPHLLLVGGPAFGALGGGYRTGALGAVALVIALLDWFSILFVGAPIAGLQPLKLRYLTWRARVLAYCAFLRDEYPPFGDGPYPAALELPNAPVTRDRLAVGLRPLLIVPHVVVLAILLLAWVVVAIVSWAYLSIAGRLPDALWEFGRDVMGYALRVESYALLVHDEFPSFALTEPDPTPRAPFRGTPTARSPLTSA
jgi:hypothetical protein